jgi:hypothetical protein
MTKPIEIRLTKAHVEWLGNEIHVMNDVNKRMRSAGIPVVGWSCIKGVEHGRLEMLREGDEYVYRWHPDPAKVKKYDPLNDDEDESL